MPGRFFVYILASRSRTLYVGVTRDLLRRVFEHKQKAMPGFTEKYRIDRLVYFEETEYLMGAVSREKKIKAWRRSKKIDLIESMNPTWEDLARKWYDFEDMQHQIPRCARN